MTKLLKPKYKIIRAVI